MTKPITEGRVCKGGQNIPPPGELQQRPDPPQGSGGTTIDVPSIGLGTMRTSATYIGILLQLEDRGDAVDVLVSAAKASGLSLEEIVESWNDTTCSKCGCSVRLHEDGQCPYN